MPRNANVTLPTRTWTQVTANDISAFRAQILQGRSVFLQATVGEVAPSTTDGSIALAAGPVLPANLLLSELWPGITGATRVYAYADNDGGAVLSISHA